MARGPRAVFWMNQGAGYHLGTIPLSTSTLTQKMTRGTITQQSRGKLLFLDREWTTEATSKALNTFAHVYTSVHGFFYWKRCCMIFASPGLWKIIIFPAVRLTWRSGGAQISFSPLSCAFSCESCAVDDSFSTATCITKGIRKARRR